MSEVRTKLDHIIYSSSLLTIGLFRCPTWHQAFSNTGPASNYLLVFPRSSVIITQSGHQPVVANPNVVMFYNRHQEYERGKLSDWGDVCEFFAFSPPTIIEVHRQVDPTVEARAERPFRFSHTTSHPHNYLKQRRIVQRILSGAQLDSMYIEETMLSILSQSVQTAYQHHDTHFQKRQESERNHAELVHRTQSILSTRFAEGLTLTQIALELNSSVYHLCRIFRGHTGLTIHNYLNQIRLRSALEWVAEGSKDLANVALNLGYSHHSHFTQAFRRTFGLTPRAWRQQASSHRLEKMSKILTV